MARILRKTVPCSRCRRVQKCISRDNINFYCNRCGRGFGIGTDRDTFYHGDQPIKDSLPQPTQQVVTESNQQTETPNE